jgi:hypothetical protein
MNVLSIEEQPDGSAIVEVEMTEKEKDMFIEIGILTCLKEGIKQHEDNLRTPAPE